MNISQLQIKAVLSLPGEDRYRHFVKTVVDREEAWGLYQDGWAIACTNEGEAVFPLWPLKEYAQLCAIEDWEGYSPQAISLDDLTTALLPKLRDEGVLPGVFYTPSGKGVTPSIDTLEHDLQEELERY